MELDTSTEFGARVERRLREELVIWLTTVRPDGRPEPSPVWFLWDGETFLIYSQHTQKLRNIQNSSKAALNFDGDGIGGNIVVITGQAEIASEAPPANEVAAYVQKYQRGFERIGLSAEGFAQSYSVAIRVRPTRLRGH